MLTIIVAAVGVAQTSAGQLVLRKAGLFEPSRSYTSLAFEHPRSLPQQLTAAQAAVPVTFVVSNSGHAPRTYQWTLSLVQGPLTRAVATGRVQVASGHHANLTQVARIACTQQRVRLVVSLAHPAESIDDLITCPPATRPSS